MDMIPFFEKSDGVLERLNGCGGRATVVAVRTSGVDVEVGLGQTGQVEEGECQCHQWKMEHLLGDCFCL